MTASTPAASLPYPRGDLRRSAWLRGFAQARQFTK
ncbi:Rmf/CrpP family protein [Streptomyces gardneri]